MSKTNKKMSQKEIIEAIQKVDSKAFGEFKLQNTQKYFTKADSTITNFINKNPEFGEKLENGKIKYKNISEAYVLDNDGKERPVIDLVQQGGGMLGIALLGYTYTMEKLGVRFHSHGGTSAGGINALFLAAIPNSIYESKSIFQNDDTKYATKSEILTHIVANTDFSAFMDREGVTGWLQEMALKFYKKRFLVVIVLLLLLLLLLLPNAIFSLIFMDVEGISFHELRTFDFLIGTACFIGLILFVFASVLILMKNNFGINEGIVFYEWADDLLKTLHVNDTQQLRKTLNLIDITRPPRTEHSKHPDPRLVLISSNLSFNRIVKFPERADDYWTNKNAVKPAAYLRATMSIPFVFQTFRPKVDHYYPSQSVGTVKNKVRFVDGGMLSNFPIREFHREDMENISFPTFGVLLHGQDKEQQSDAQDLSFFKHVLSFLSTFRNFYDNDFLQSSDEIKMRVATIDTKGYNWLNFWMKPSTKLQLFNKGVEAALNHLNTFNWDLYYKERTKQ